MMKMGVELYYSWTLPKLNLPPPPFHKPSPPLSPPTPLMLQPPAPPPLSIPVVYIYFSNGAPSSDYVWKTARISLSQGNSVVLITDIKEQQLYHPGFRLLDIQLFIDANNDLKLFRSVYQPWGLKEPWEQQNTERYFVLLRFMEREMLPWVFYADCDVAVLTRVDLLMKPNENCDAIVSLHHQAPIMQWSTTDWVVWAGTSLLSYGVLKDFIEFVPQTYQYHLPVLEYKRSNAPYVCDMTLWYLFAGKAEPSLAKRWGWPDPAGSLTLPVTGHAWRFCDILEYGFDHHKGYLSNKSLQEWKSLHFQGDGKTEIDKVLGHTISE